MRPIISLLGVVVSAALALNVSAGPVLVPTAQNRSVNVSAFVFSETQQDSRSASGFGDFNESLVVHPIQIVDGTRWAAQGQASQNSTLGSDAFKFSGKIYAQATHIPGAGGTS